ncbi:helix-turn-helix domain-containing protein [Rhizobium sp. SL86]|uniref:helix-turn-helix domain-containing protein n=1 Tax=Rhizobium sp. SL86 TaxID=2995148 RepID=UPI0022757B78|nr:helix-turn-helix transcriptional regulator [Rhizobium sp. SL86]MCY1668741.1 helix-turn-helix transcriptional regulator [Rhizobium sp. SL86]
MGNDEFGWSFDADDTLGGRMSLAREARNLTVEQVAHAINSTPDTVRYWENDRAAPSLDRLLIIADALDVAASWLMTGFGHGPNWDDLTELPRDNLARSRPSGSPSQSAR